MFESDEVVRRKVREMAGGLPREEVVLRKDEARSRCGSTRVYCGETAMRRERLERYAVEWERVLDEMTGRGPAPR
ncbi:hypothetical protein ACFVU3_38160 [Streptomyces sp. NPDC058052]|uniref:hypothetical protein n=1 Tax=Streptomyces sp. NPDC058052 TaxID=3346316 RepID=UPI0036ECF176